MNLIQRQMLLGQRRLRASLAASESPAVRDEPIPRTEPLRSGLAKIDSNQGSAAYKVTELWWDPAESQWVRASGPLGHEQADAVDYMGNGTGGVNQTVRFWEHRGFGGQVRLFIDVSGGWDGFQRISSFCAHYSGTNTTSVFHSVPNCKNAFVEVGVDLRRCSGNGSASDHPGHTTMASTGGFLGFGWCNALATWSGGDWHSLKYVARTAGGALEGDGSDAIQNFHVQCRVTAEGDLDFRIENLTGGTVSAVIVAAIRVSTFPEPPGALELGDCCCHDDPDWNAHEWGEIPQ